MNSRTNNHRSDPSKKSEIMTRNDLARISVCCRRHQQSICVRFGIVISVCFLLCTVCFLVEKRRDNGRPMNDERVHHSSEKLIQIKHHGLYDESTQTVIDVALQADFNNDDDDGSGQYQEPVISHYVVRGRATGDCNHIPKSVPLDSDEFDMMTATTNFHSGPGAAGVDGGDSEVGASETSHHFDELQHKSDLDMGKSSIEKMFENLPRFSEIQPQSSESSVAPFHDLPERESMGSEELDDERDILITIKDLSHEELPAEPVDSAERFFSEEFALDLGNSKSVEDNPFDKGDDDFVMTNFDNGNYMQLKPVERVSPPAKEVRNNAPSLLHSFFGRMNDLLSKPPSSFPEFPAKFQFQAPHHLSNFKDSPYRHDHLVQESAYVVPILTTRPHFEAEVAPSVRPVPALSPTIVISQQHRQQLPKTTDVWHRLFGPPPTISPNHNAFNMFSNLVHKIKLNSPAFK